MIPTQIYFVEAAQKTEVALVSTTQQVVKHAGHEVSVTRIRLVVGAYVRNLKRLQGIS